MKIVLKYAVLFLIGSSLYYCIEIAFRGYSHFSMWILGGIVFIYAGIQNEVTPWEMPFIQQVLQVEIFILIAEFITGCIVNLWIGWNVWDYSKLPGNILGQICPQFALIWLPLVCLAIILDDYLRYWFFDEEKPHYIWF